MRFAAAQGVEPSIHPGLHVDGFDLATLGVEPIDGGDGLTDVDEACGQVEQVDVSGVPGDEAQVLVDHADALVDIVESGLQQFPIELDRLRSLVEHPHYILGSAAASGQGCGDDAAGGGRPDRPGQHPLGRPGETGVGRVAVAKDLIGLPGEGVEGAVRPRVADEPRHQAPQIADRRPGRGLALFAPVGAGPVDEGAGLDPVDQAGRRGTRHQDEGEGVGGQAGKNPER